MFSNWLVAVFWLSPCFNTMWTYYELCAYWEPAGWKHDNIPSTKPKFTWLHITHALSLTQVSMACKDQVPDFGPPLCSPSIFRKGPEFRDWLITKLLNAEFNCHKAPDFLKLAVRTYIMHSCPLQKRHTVLCIYSLWEPMSFLGIMRITCYVYGCEKGSIWSPHVFGCIILQGSIQLT